MKELEITRLFDLDHTLAASYLSRFTYPWEALSGLSDFILELGRSLPADEYEQIGENVWAARSAKIAPTASITGPAIIGQETEVRHCAFIRGSALVDETGAVAEAAYYRPSIATLIQRLAQEDAQVTYVPAVRSSYVRYHDENGDLYQIWFESAESVTDKINLARMFGVTGVSVWRLGNVPNSESYDLWSAILAQR